MILNIFKKNNILFHNYNKPKKIWDGTHYLPVVSKKFVEKNLTLLIRLREKYKEQERNKHKLIYTDQKETYQMYKKRKEENHRRWLANKKRWEKNQRRWAKEQKKWSNFNQVQSKFKWTDPIYNINEYLYNYFKKTHKSVFFNSMIRAKVLKKSIYDRYNLSLEYFLYYSFFKIKFKEYSNTLKKRYKKINLLDTQPIFYNFLFPKYYKHLLIHKQNYYKKTLLFLEQDYKNWYIKYLNPLKKNALLFSLERSRLNLYMRLSFKSFEKPWVDNFLKKKIKNYYIKNFFYYFFIYRSKLFFKKNYSNFFFINWSTKRYRKKKLYWKKFNISKYKKMKKPFRFKRIYRFDFKYNRTNYFDYNIGSNRRIKKIPLLTNSIYKKNKFLRKKYIKIRFMKKKKKYFHVKKTDNKMRYLWKYFFFIRRSTRRYYYFLDTFKKFYDCFYTVNRFVNWYSVKNNKHNIIYLYSQYRKYTIYNNTYNKLFLKNYKNILDILNCYFFFNRKKNKFFYRKVANDKIKKFIIRKQKLYNFNFFYRLVLKKKALKNYYFFFYKKLNDLNFYKKKDDLFNSYINDISMLYYDNFLNWKYLKILDEKMYFYYKHLLFNKLKNKLQQNYFYSKKDSTKYKHLLSFQNNYLIYYKKFFISLSIQLLEKNNYKHSIFYSSKIIKYFIFITKHRKYYFFKEFLIYQLKWFFYKLKINPSIYKKGIIYKNREYNWLELFTFYFKEFNNYEYYGKKEMYIMINYISLSEISLFFHLNEIDWFYYIVTFLKLKKNIIGLNHLYKNIYVKKYKSLRKKSILTNVYNHLFFTKKLKFNFSNIQSNLVIKNKHYRTFLEKKEKYFYIEAYKKYFSYFLRKELKKVRSFRSFKKRRKRTLWYENKDLFFQKNLKKITGRFFNKMNPFNNKYYFRKYFELFNGIYKKKKTIHFNNFFNKIWVLFIKNKRVSIYLILNLVSYIYKIIKKNIYVHQKHISFIYSNYYLIRFFLFREKYFNVFFFLTKKKHYTFNKKKKNLKNKLPQLPISYNTLKRRKLFFFLSTHYNVYMCFFFFFKKMVLEKIINNSFVYYKNKIIFFDLKNNFIFLKQKNYQFDYFIKDFLNEEIETLYK